MIFNVYYKRRQPDKQQKSLWLLLTTLAISDTVEIVIYLTTYSLLYHIPESDYILRFFTSNRIWLAEI